MGSKCKALSHGRAMCWPVKGLRTSGEGESDIYKIIMKIIIRRDGSGSRPIHSRLPRRHRFVMTPDTYKRIRHDVIETEVI